MSLTSKQIATSIRRKILEQTSDLVTDDVLFMNMNLAYDDIKIGSFSADQISSATIPLVNGIGSLPSNFGTLYGPAYLNATDKVPYEEVSIADFYRDQTKNAITVEGGQLMVSPSSTASVIVKYYPSYDALTFDQDPEVNSYFHELIIYGAMYRIHQDLQNESMSEYYRNLFDTLFKNRANALSNYQEDNADGGTMFNPIRIF